MFLRKPGELKLEAAKDILDEAAEQTSDIQGFWKTRITAEEISKVSFWRGVGAHRKISADINALERNLNEAIVLAKEAASENSQVEIREEGVALTPETLISNAYFQKGVLYLCQEKWEDARRWIEQSQNVMNHPTSQLFLGHTLAWDGYRQDAIEAFQRTIDIYPNSEEAIDATRALSSLRQMKPKKWRTALLLSIFIGINGADRFYLGDVRNGILKLVTVGGFFIWWITDIIKIYKNSIRDINGMRLEK